MRTRHRGAVLFKILGVLVGIVFLVVGVNSNSRLRSLKASGLPAVVEPIAGYTEHKKRGMTTYTSEFTFTTQDGKKITRKSSFPGELIDDFKSRVPVKVLYDANDPSEFVFEKEQSSWFLVWAGVGVAAAALLFA
jgi:hypothetical protein